LNRSFRVARVIPIGSHAKGTALKGYSDVDILAVLRRREARWGGAYVNSETFLRNVRVDLVERYPATEIRRDGQAAVVHFAQGAYLVDVVPAIYFQAAASGHPIYRIPDGAGGWQPTAPEIHAAYLAAADRRSGGKLRHVVQLIKLWVHDRATALPLSSFHLEMILAAARTCEGVMPVSRALTLAFLLLESRAGAALRDPCGISGLILATETEAKRQLLTRSLESAADHARAAYEAEQSGDKDEAIRQWRIIFGQRFPLTVS
jgi:hypothetical protein